jgi:streptogramin lyase
MAVTARDIWVTGNSPSVLARIDPETNAIVSQSPLDGSPCGIAVGPDGRLWIALLSVGRVVAIDPATGEVTATIADLGAQLWDLKAGFGAIWVVDRSNRELLRIDARSAAIVARMPLGPSGSGLAITETAVWVADDVDGIVRRIDPATNVAAAASELPRGAGWFANDERTLLVANRLDGSITPIDPADGGAEDPIRGSRNPLDGTVLMGRAYIPDGKAGTVVEVDVATGKIGPVDRLDGARMPFVAEVAFDDVWVLDFGGQRIWRMSP